MSISTDYPTITTSSYTSQLYNPNLTDSITLSTGSTGGVFNTTTDWHEMAQQFRIGSSAGGNTLQISQPVQTPPLFMATKRIVRVYLADTDDNVPLEKSLLFTSPEKFTDLTDQELYFEIPIQEALKTHNAFRATVLDKKATNRLGKEVFLEAVKIRDLKMMVVNIATF